MPTLLLTLLGCAPPAPSAPTAPDLVFISLDTTRADALGVYGEALPTTPHHDALAAKGVRFAWALAQSPSTLASHSTVFTGLDAHGTRIVRNGFPLPDDVETIAERLTHKGYDTMAILGSSALARPMGADQGFRVWDEDFSIKRTKRHEATATEVTDRALAHLAQREPGKPLFLFAHYYDAHGPYDAPEPYKHRWSAPGMAGTLEGREGALTQLAAQIRAGIADPAKLQEVRAMYLGEVSYVDAEVGRLVEHLDLSRTVIVVFGDHGEMLGEEHLRPFGHGADVDLPVTHVPLFFVGPGIPAGRVVDAPVGLQDLAATALAAIGQTEPFGQSHDLSPTWSEHPPALDRTWMLEATQPGYTTPEHGWNNLVNEQGALGGGSLLTAADVYGEGPRLFSVAPGQPADPDPVRAHRLTDALRAWNAAAPPFRTVEMDTTVKEGLKALGYQE